MKKNNKHWVLLREDDVVAVVNDEKIMKLILKVKKKFSSLDIDLIGVPEVNLKYLKEMVEDAGGMDEDAGGMDEGIPAKDEKPILLKAERFGDNIYVKKRVFKL